MERSFKLIVRGKDGVHRVEPIDVDPTSQFGDLGPLPGDMITHSWQSSDKRNHHQMLRVVHRVFAGAQRAIVVEGAELPADLARALDLAPR